MRRLSGLLFPSTIVVRPTIDDYRRMRIAAHRMNDNHKTNLNEKSLELQLYNTVRGMIVEYAVKQVLGLDLTVKTSIDLNNPDSYNHDAEWEDGWIEVKCITAGHEEHELVSYHKISADTLMKHRGVLNAIVFGSCRNVIPDTEWHVDILWLINPVYYCEPYLTKRNYSVGDKDMTYYVFNPRAHRSMREPEVCLWNKRLLNGITFTAELNFGENSDVEAA